MRAKSCWVALWIVGNLLTSAEAGQEAGPEIDATWQERVVEAVAKNLEQSYVFPDKASEMAKVIRTQLGNGFYRGLSDGRAFADRLTRDLQAVSKDRHLRVSFSLKPRPAEADEPPTPEEIERYRAEERWNNYGFEKVTRLPGNIGYLELLGFHGTERGASTAIAAMSFLSNSDAIIIDLRRNGGGSPAMVALITSYFFGEEPVHLNSLYFREQDSTHQWWTLPYVPGRRRPDVPLYVLTSRRTFSAAEEFSYNLRAQERATLVGEVTGGGAHPGESRWIDAHFSVWVPEGRAINPITGTNWEGTGVQPHIEVPADQALDRAHAEALRGLIETAADEETRERLKSLLTRLESGGHTGGD